MDNADNALARALQAIDDPAARRANLTSLVATLPPWERRHVRLELGPRDGLAGLEDLPVDLACVLLRHLHIEDVLACAAVCTRCRATWTEPTVVVALTRHFFPFIRDSPSVSSFSAFRAACRRYIRRRAGKFTSGFEIPLPYAAEWTSGDVLRPGPSDILQPDPWLHPDGVYPVPWPSLPSFRFGCYGGGNVVWLGPPDYFVVDNLRARTRRVVEIPAGRRRGGPSTRNPVASESLIVLHFHPENKLYVFLLPLATYC